MVIHPNRLVDRDVEIAGERIEVERFELLADLIVGRLLGGGKQQDDVGNPGGRRLVGS